MTFHSRDFQGRFATLGDPAEQAFLERNPKAHRLGLCRPEFSMNGMAATMRYAPDFMLRTHFVECMGIATGGSGTLKVKLEKLNALRMWEVLGDVRLWVWDSSKGQYWDAGLDDWENVCHLHGDKKFFADNNKAYWELHHRDFPVEPSC
jgi:hypothetical protein